ncbi:hypothetical protein BO94DRAFT_615903 [Aspergillus sclerotioniger CBS 115572]|uniref:P-loop containing nucleoside triphosphate hydrolase protein n=1 Tax=Aspergillus sclerotioniger CBS 115572 TaxID=1450535 RepID=A0A317X384_9EURO|nr:hypothetical protein BO94DRAFT_615903 [Aspergillus sclerotioniger CBS 115572]PWY93089.1 hypothetical protein BO94DRAFT_615903 [Aspergillus sclerotioniger CBS 115572]
MSPSEEAQSVTSSDESPSSNSSTPPPSTSVFHEPTIKYHMSLLPSTHISATTEGYEHAPIISSHVLHEDQKHANQITQYGLLAASIRPLLSTNPDEPENDPRLFFNVTHPSSTFICGSQGSGKSHTLSCLLENCLIPSQAGRLTNPLTAVVFHYDTFTSDESAYPCEAAWISSHPDVKVRVFCAPTNLWTMQETYSEFNIPIEPLHIDQQHLTTKRMMDLMAVSQTDGEMPLYMHTVKRILREMRIRQQETKTGFNYNEFKKQVLGSGLTPAQVAPLQQRLDTLESFMPQAQVARWSSRNVQQKKEKGSSWDAVPGQLTIVDLSCPCISPETACSLFNICLGIFLKPDPEGIGRVVALDEAHKYMTTTPESQLFTETLLSTVRLQRHLGARVIISTQEPTISTTLLNLCSVIVVHRFTSPEWLRILTRHVAGAVRGAFTSRTNPNCKPVGGEEEEEVATSLFEDIVRLGVGEALVFAPNAVVGTGMRKLGEGVLGVKVRARLTEDGGRSLLSG